MQLRGADTKTMKLRSCRHRQTVEGRQYCKVYASKVNASQEAKSKCHWRRTASWDYVNEASSGQHEDSFPFHYYGRIPSAFAAQEHLRNNQREADPIRWKMTRVGWYRDVCLSIRIEMKSIVSRFLLIDNTCNS
jgi:hypothetical protein